VSAGTPRLDRGRAPGQVIYCEKRSHYVGRDQGPAGSRERQSSCSRKAASNSHLNLTPAADLERQIGQLQTVMIGSAAGAEHRAPAGAEAEPPPSDFNYDMWLGPAPYVPYTPERVARHLDVHTRLRPGILEAPGHPRRGTSPSGSAQRRHDPVETEGEGIFYDDIRDVPHHLDRRAQVRQRVRVITWTWPPRATRRRQFNAGGMASVMFGTEGWIYISRQGMRTEPSSLIREVIGPTRRRSSLATTTP